MRVTLCLSLLFLFACDGDVDVPDARTGQDASPSDADVDRDATGTVDASRTDQSTPDLGAPDAILSGACNGQGGARTESLSVEAAGRTRSFSVHLPPNYNGVTPLSVVVNFHGRMGNGSQQNLLSGMTAFADTAGFVAVHPEGIGGTWNAGLCCGTAMTTGVDDVSFARAMVEKIKSDFCVDAKRVYATGLSNGGFISHRVGCELSDVFAAIAPVAGTNLSSSCSPSRAVPVMHFHGTSDNVVRYNGFVGFASVDDTIDDWVDRNGCGGSGTDYFTQGDVTCTEWGGCRNNATVRRCRIEGGGHQWPGGVDIPFLGNNTDNIKATEAMWDFFQLHSL